MGFRREFYCDGDGVLEDSCDLDNDGENDFGG